MAAARSRAAKPPHPGERAQLAELVGDRSLGGGPYAVLEHGGEPARVLERATADHRGHDRCRGTRQRAAAALEGDLGHHAIGDPRSHRDHITAQRVIDGRVVGRAGQRAVVVGLAIVLDDRRLVEFVDLAPRLAHRLAPRLAHRSTRRTRARLAISASTSASSL
jgi:hypothetical protein